MGRGELVPWQAIWPASRIESSVQMLNRVVFFGGVTENVVH